MAQPSTVCGPLLLVCGALWACVPQANTQAPEHKPGVNRPTAAAAKAPTAAEDPRASAWPPDDCLVDTLVEQEGREYLTAIEAPLFREPVDKQPIAIVRAGVVVQWSPEVASDFRVVEVPLPALLGPEAFPKGEPHHLAGWMPQHWSPSASTLGRTERTRTARYGLVRTLSFDLAGESVSFVRCGKFWEFEPDASGQYVHVLADWPAGAVFGWMRKAAPAAQR